MKVRSIIPILLVVWGCAGTDDHSPDNRLPELRSIPLATETGMAPNLFVDEAGTVYLSWIEFLNDSTDALMYARLEGNRWSGPVQIATGTDWFANWADFPALVAFPGTSGKLAAHWLQKSAGGTYDYDIRVTISDSTGRNWGPSFMLHNDGIPAEHGFVSMAPVGEDRILACWLDGRNTKSAEDSDHGVGAMTLRTAEFDKHGNRFFETELDQRVCDCCQTGLAIAHGGPVVVYRDRSQDEIRDIALVRREGYKWTVPRIPVTDEWHTTACPVNGPAVAARNEHLAVAWFTAAGEKPTVRLLLSTDSGRSFTNPVEISDTRPLGRVDVQWFDDSSGLVSWVEQTGDRQAMVKLSRWDIDGTISNTRTLLPVSPARASGFPQLAVSDERIILAITETEPNRRIRTYEVTGK